MNTVDFSRDRNDRAVPHELHFYGSNENGQPSVYIHTRELEGNQMPLTKFVEVLFAIRQKTGAYGSDDEPPVYISSRQAVDLAEKLGFGAGLSHISKLCSKNPALFGARKAPPGSRCRKELNQAKIGLWIIGRLKERGTRPYDEDGASEPGKVEQRRIDEEIK